MTLPARTLRVIAGIACLALAAVALAGVAVAGLGPSAAAQYQYPPAEEQYGKKALVCHKGKKTLRIGKAALRAHLRHGDRVGRCTSPHRKHAAKHRGGSDDRGKGRGHDHKHRP